MVNEDLNENHGIGSFSMGLIILCIALPMVWMNERKYVRYFEVIDEAK
jgi:hypothetical protein